MSAIKKALFYGFLLWLLPFILSVVIFPLKAPEPELYHSVLGIASILLAIILTVFYFRKINTSLKDGLLLGIIFLVISLFFDFIMFIWGPIAMAPDLYLKQIGIGYITYLLIATGFTFLPKAPQAQLK